MFAIPPSHDYTRIAIVGEIEPVVFNNNGETKFHGFAVHYQNLKRKFVIAP
jgi:hypothetical protein